MRRLAVECSWGYSRGILGHKSVELKKRQKDMPAEVIAYADRAADRCRRKYYRMTAKEKNANKTVTAVARELCCFIWGMATSHYENIEDRPKELPEL